MICYHCRNLGTCDIFRNLYSMSNDFEINQCKHYDTANNYKYMKIAEHQDLMHLIYDYFTDNLPDDIGEKEAKEAIIHAILYL